MAWAVVGAAVLAFEVFVLARWVSGPLFETVPVGPSDPPTFMKVAMVVFQDEDPDVHPGRGRGVHPVLHR